MRQSTQIARRLRGLIPRRALLRTTAAAALVGTSVPARAGVRSSLTFAEVTHGPSPTDAIAAGYHARPVIRWGDPVIPGVPAFQPLRQSAERQAGQFGNNNDFLAFLPLPRGSAVSDHGLLWANHEYPQSNMMFPGVSGKAGAAQVTAEQVDVELQCVGASVVEVRRVDGTWVRIQGARNRRITATTPVRLGGPASGHPRLRTKADPAGTIVLGTIANCAGGVTPWGSVLTCEENFDQYFAGDCGSSPEAASHRRIGLRPSARYGWSRFHERFDMAREPNEPNRFGWVVEVDPYDPAAMPVKRTALGRFKHECAETALTPDGRLVVYMGDDERNEYVYRFVSRDKVNRVDPAANAALLDHGTLSVGRLEPEGTLTWLPLVFGTGPLTAANGFNGQADVLIETRRAADLLGATPMDRPEDIGVSPVTGKVYVVLTNNTQRKQTDPANPRAENRYGHILELLPPGGDHAADHFNWNVFLLAGNPEREQDGARYGGALSASGWLACPDNLAFDPRGRMWIASDQGEQQAEYGIGDGIWACDTEGPGRAVTRMFYRVPTGAEMCGPAFTPDGTTLFVAVQHPAGDDAGSSFDAPSTRWPDFRDDMPPRAAVVAITRSGGGDIGG